MKGDFHIHTTYSDGVLTVEEIIEQAKDLDYLAITDHDVLTGALEAYNKQLNKDLKIIVGLELSTEYMDESVHILGFFSNLSQIESFNRYLEKQRTLRLERAHKINELLNLHFNINLNMDFVEKIDSITRGTIASEIIKQGYPYTKEEIFKKMIGNDSPAYIPSTKLKTAYGIKKIHEAHGLAVLAHPVLLRKASVEEIIDMGIDGIEAFYPVNTIEDTKKYLKIAKDDKLFVTGGSDFHSYNDHKHGNLGDVFLEGEYLKIFLKRLMEVK